MITGTIFAAMLPTSPRFLQPKGVSPVPAFFASTTFFPAIYFRHCDISQENARANPPFPENMLEF
jgi:hypothetical protein